MRKVHSFIIDKKSPHFYSMPSFQGKDPFAHTMSLSETDLENKEEIKSDVEDVLKASQQTLSVGGWSCSVDDLDDLNRILETIMQVYRNKPFDRIEWEAEWFK